MAQKYEWAVFDGNQAPDQRLRPESCHRSLAAAEKSRDRANALDPNAHYYVTHWGYERWDSMRPNDAHYPYEPR